MRGRSKKSILVDEYIIKYQEDIKSNKLKKAALARMIFNDHPEFFKSVEQIRWFIRRSTGADAASKQRGAKVILDHKGHSSCYQIPKSHAKAPQDYVINKAGKYLIFSDVHFPYHDEEALNIMLDFADGKNYKGIIINGDLADNYQNSRWLKVGHRPRLKEEYEMTRDFLQHLVDRYNTQVFWKFGNHDERVAHHMHQNIPELSEYIDGFVEDIFRLKELGVVKVDSSAKIKLGKLIVLHGHEFGHSVFSPVNPARGLFLRAKASALMGHHHQTSYHEEGNLKADRIGCWSLGCLCTLTPEYSPFAFTKWNHGFAEVDVEANGAYTVHNYRIIDGVVR